MNISHHQLHASSPIMCINAPASCGELVQGYIEGEDFLINCPINLYATAQVWQEESLGVILEGSEQFTKVTELIERITYPRQSKLYGYKMAIHTAIPRGKGMASSTADLTAALGALEGCFDFNLSPDEFANILAEIEPSDGLHFSGITKFAHISGRLLDSYPVPQYLNVVVIDVGGEVETAAFERSFARDVYCKHAERLKEAVALVEKGLLSGDLSLIGEGATISSELSQLILPKPLFQELKDNYSKWGALGINCAHSGTVLGILYDSRETSGSAIKQHLKQTFVSRLHVVGDYQIIGGGYNV